MLSGMSSLPLPAVSCLGGGGGGDGTLLCLGGNAEHSRDAGCSILLP